MVGPHTATEDRRAWTLKEATAHLRFIGLTDPCRRVQRSGWAPWVYWAQALPETVPGFDGAFLFTSAWETRVVEVVLEMSTVDRSELVQIGADKGACEMLFWRTVPKAYSEGSLVALSGDHWTIESAGTVAAASFRRMDGKIRPDYDTYIRGAEWAIRRDMALEYYGGRCCLCNNTRDLNVHHRTYERLGSERLSDLIVLCQTCHAKFHGKVA